MKGPGLCHGVAGNGYGLLALHRATGQPALLNRAVAFGRYLCRPEVRRDATACDDPFSLFNGKEVPRSHKVKPQHCSKLSS